MDEPTGVLANGLDYLKLIDKPKEILKSIFHNLFCSKFEIIDINYDTLKIITPFKDSSNDLIQIYIQFDWSSKKITMTDDGYTAYYLHIRGIDNDSLIEKIIKNYNLEFDSNKIYININFSENNLVSEKINNFIQAMIILLNLDEFY